MGSKNKLKRFKENETFHNVFQPSREELVASRYEFKGNWHQKVFKNTKPIVLELGCGKGEYSVELAKKYPHKNFIGIDIKGARFWRGAKTALEENIPNAKFYKENITKLPFEDSSVDFVFTHKLLNYLDDETVDNGVSEMFRVAKRYILNCELFGETEEKIDDEMRFRNMLKRWLNYKVRVVSNVNMHEDIEPEQVRFTLLRKL